ncbi:MAG: peroxiredoxin family protein [Nannocystaceae bacterium]|nr:TlpA family protein disulfide reductase [bacterium]
MKRLGVALLLSGCAPRPTPTPPEAPPPTPPTSAVDAASAEASAAPTDGAPIDLDIPLVSGDAEPLAGLRGKVVVLLLSSTDRAGWAEFREHYEARLQAIGRARLVVITVANDPDAETLQAEWDRDPPPFLLGWDPAGALALRLGVAALPAVFVLDPQGRPVGSLASVEAAALTELDGWVDEVLPPPPPPEPPADDMPSAG